MKNLDFPASFRARFEIRELLGQGGMGVVVRALDRDLDRNVVVKTLRSRMASHPGMVARFEREARTLAKMKHPRVLSLLDFGVEEGQFFTIHPYMPGSDLRRRLARDAFALAPRMTWLEEALEGLAHSHEAGVLHRDLKPENLYVKDDDHLVLIDFGLARGEEDETLTGTGMLLGTPAYLDPIVLREPEWKPSADLYGMGVIAYEMFTGKNPFLGEDLEEVCRKHATLVPPPPHETRPEIPPPLSYLVMSMIEKRAEDRPGSATEALARLREIPRPAGDVLEIEGIGEDSTAEAPLHTLPLATPSIPPTPAPPAPTPDVPTRSWTPVVVALALSAGLGIGFQRSPSSPPPEPITSSAAPAPGVPAALLGLPSETRVELDARFDARDPTLPWGDPVTWRSREATLRGPERLRRWVVTGGDPSTLPEDFRAALRSLDEDARGLGGPPLFGAMATATPRRPVRSDRLTTWVALPPEEWWSENGPSWRGAALAALSQANDQLVAITTTSATPAALRPFMADTNARFLVSRERDFRYEEVYGNGTAARQALATWMRKGVDAYATMLFALGQSLRHEGPDPTLARVAVSWLHAQRWFALSHLAQASPEHLLGITPGHPSEHLVATQLLVIQARIQRLAGQLDPTLPGRYREHVRAAMDLASLGTRDADTAMHRLMHLLSRVPDELATPAQYEALLASAQEALALRPEETRREMWQVFRDAFEPRKGRPPREDLLARYAGI